MLGSAVMYRVAKGDTILSICQEHGLSYPQFVKLNPNFDVTGHRDPGVIYIGEMFVVGYISTDPLSCIEEES